MGKEFCSKDFRVAVTLATPSESDDGAGGQTVTFTDFMTSWCMVRVGGGIERFVNEKLTDSGMFILTTRFDPRVVTGMRAAFNGRVCRVRDVVEHEGRFDFMIITVEEGAGQ